MEFEIEKTNKKHLKQLKFRKKSGENDFSYFTKVITLEKYNNSPVLSCEIKVFLRENQSAEVIVDVYNSGTFIPYALFYNDNGTNKFVNKLKHKIRQEVDKIKIEERSDVAWV